MAGNSNSGRKRKSIEARIAEGSYRPQRHGDIVAKIEPAKATEKPSQLSEDESWFWDQLMTTGHVAVSDVPMALTACQLWGLFQGAVKVAKEAPLDKDARLAVSGYGATLAQLASRFGMTPTDRSVLGIVTDRPQAVPTVRRRDRSA